MLFYEEFIKNIKNNLELKGKERFTLDIKKTIFWLGTGLPILVMGITEMMMFSTQKTPKDFVLAVIFTLISLRHLKMYFSYKIILDFEEDKLISKDVNLSFKDIKSCILKEEVIGKKGKVQAVLEIITKEKKRIIIPLMMNKQLRFVSLLNSRLKNIFVIEK